ncbi:DUF6538 domain-containing protein [Luteibacter sp. NPDC031894]|uniref:DUF6538 domain-containing protein n=1 Tax=Luteibacter sp. NPDC031894 TaxID=3390572 RepID=UPI003CFFFB78
MAFGQSGWSLRHADSPCAPLLRHPSGTFHFRLVVPADLRATFGKKIVKISLWPKDPAAARAYRAVHIRVALEGLPADMPLSVQVADLLDRYLDREGGFGRDPAKPRGSCLPHLLSTFIETLKHWWWHQ